MAKKSDRRLSASQPSADPVVGVPGLEEAFEEQETVAQDAHTSHEIDPARMDRELTDNRDVSEDRELTDIERLDMLRLELAQDRLPNLPKIPGWHMIWLSTNNASDTVAQRLRLGYQLIKASELPGWDHSVASEGSYAGYIMVNEMIAAKLPMRLYQMYMKHFHHDEPLREQGKLVANLDGLRQQAEQHGAKLIEGDGMQALRESVPVPVFQD